MSESRRGRGPGERLETAEDKTEQGKGLGADLLMHALFTIVQVAEDLGIRAVEVKAKNDPARRFYSKYGFESLLDDPLHMYVALEMVRRAFIPPDPQRDGGASTGQVWSKNIGSVRCR